MSLDFELNRSNFIKPEIIEPQHRCSKKKRCKHEHQMSEMDNKSITKSAKEKDKSVSSDDIETLCTNNFSLTKMEVKNTTESDNNNPTDWTEKIITRELDGNIQPIKEISITEHKYRNIYSFSNEFQTNNKSSNIEFGVKLKKSTEEKTEEFLCNMHKYLVDYQETCGTPRTEYPFAALIQEIGQITGRCLLALLYMIISLPPMIQIFLYILRFILDKVIIIRYTSDYYQMFVKYLVLVIQSLSVCFGIAIIFNFIVLPVLQIGLSVIAKILFYN